MEGDRGESRRVTDVDETIERDGQEIAIVLEIDWKYDGGSFVEPGHPCNGYGAGSYANVSAVDAKTNAPIELTPAEIERFQEKYPPRESEPDDDF
jgi:hypothetical protein